MKDLIVGNLFGRLFIVIIPISLAFIGTIRSLYDVTYGVSSWAFADWLITYADGFVRRGLSGEIVIFLASATGGVQRSYFLINLLLYLVIFIFILVKYHRQFPDISCVYLFLPSSILFFIWDPAIAGRKETLLFAYCCLIAVAGQRSAITARGWALHGAVCSVFILMSELLFFFLPLVFACSRLAQGQSFGSLTDKAFLSFISTPTIVFLLIVATRAQVDLAILYASIPEVGPALARQCFEASPDASWMEKGAICYLNQPLRAALTHVFLDVGPQYFLGALAIVLLQLAAAVGLFVWFSRPPLEYSRTVFFLCLFCTAPLYVLAIDWGRWTFVTTLIFLIFMPDRSGAQRTAATNGTFLFAAILLSVYTTSHTRSAGFTLRGPLYVHGKVLKILGR